MSTTPLLPLALATALCAGLAGYAHAESPDDLDPPECTNKKKALEQHFCCESAQDKDGRKSGSGCETVDRGDIKACTRDGGTVLYCPGSWILDAHGKATC